MIIKKFQGATEAEAVLKAKEELGSSAVVVNVKTMKHRGVARLFKKDYVEITAALEEKIYVTGEIPQNVVKEDNAIEEKLDTLQSLLENKMKEDVVHMKEQEAEEKEKKRKQENEKENEKEQFVKLVYNQMIKNEVDEKYANQIIAEIQSLLRKETNMDTILAAVYQKIILKLGQIKTIHVEEDHQKVVFLVGPTGVGKTTTIAKIAADFKLNKDIKVALITADTYRIAAVEQLKTYANIIDVPLKVVYTVEEFNQAVKEYEQYDLILVDTAGRSHKNAEQCEELYHLVEDCNLGDEIEKECYLVLSLTTKYKDLMRILDVFGKLAMNGLIFTKLDETTCVGNVLNLRLYSGLPLSYLADGQSVPDDISVVNPQMIAKSILAEGGER